MRKRDYCLCKNKYADQLCSNCTADVTAQLTRPLFLLHKQYNSSFFLIQNFKLLAICACTAPFVSDLFGNHIVGFLMTWLSVLL